MTKNNHCCIKNVLALVVIAIVLIGLASCNARGDVNYNNFDTKLFYSNYKQDANIDAGKKAAVYGERIYYLGAEDGNQGVYSMTADGKDIRMEFAAEDVRKLQIMDNGIYYSGYIGMSKNSNGEFRSFQLKFHSAHEGDKSDVLVDQDENGIWDFYINKYGYTIIDAHSEIWGGRPTLSTYVVGDNGKIRSQDFNEIFHEKDLGTKGTTTSLYSLGELLFTADQFRTDDFTFQSNDTSVFSKNKNVMLMGGDAVFDNSPNVYMIRSENERGLIFSINNEVLLLSGDKYTVTAAKQIEGEASIRFLLDLGDTAYLICDKKDGRQAIYSLDLDTLESTVIKECAKNERVLWLDSGKAVTVKDKTVTIWSIQNGQLSENRTIDLKENIVQKEYKTDVAGNWLFVYKFNNDTNRDELAYKLQIGD